MIRQDILFVDGYNMIGDWPELLHLKKQEELAAARDLLLFELSNYRKFRNIELIVVFDAHHVPGITKSYDEYELEVVFTQEGETADSYIEREVSHYIHPLNRVVVATSDSAEQWMIFQQGALRKSARELYMDINYTKKEINRAVKGHHSQHVRRRSPWGGKELQKLDQLRKQIEKDKPH